MMACHSNSFLLTYYLHKMTFSNSLYITWILKIIQVAWAVNHLGAFGVQLASYLFPSENVMEVPESRWAYPCQVSQWFYLSCSHVVAWSSLYSARLSLTCTRHFVLHYWSPAVYFTINTITSTTYSLDINTLADSCSTEGQSFVRSCFFFRQWYRSTFFI